MSAALQQKPELKVQMSVVKGPHAGQTFQFDKIEITIGRGPENDLILMNDPQVSRLHAKIVLVDRDFEIMKVSQKNSVIVDGESVDKWKLISGSAFVVGDTEIKIEYGLGSAVTTSPVPAIVPVRNSEATMVAENVKPLPLPVSQPVRTPPPAVAKTPFHVVPSSDRAAQPFTKPSSPFQTAQPHPSRTVKQKSSLVENSQFRFYAVAAIVIIGAVFFLLKPSQSKQANKIKPTLKYEDEINIKLNSTPEKELIKKREETKIERSSPQRLRAEENFQKGMRDYQLGQYLRAIDFFQVVLNLEPDHALAKRHQYLAKLRFDELVQSKLMLGESYYSKHNFNMCASIYQQVMDMLDDKKADSKYKLAERKNKECELAAEGIR